MTSQSFAVFSDKDFGAGIAEITTHPQGGCHLPYAVVAEIESNDRTSNGALITLVNNLHSHYASFPEMAGEDALIRLCRYVNEHAVSLTGKTPAWLKKLSLTIAVADDHTISLASIGSMRAFVARRGRVIDILSVDSPSPAAASNALKSASTASVSSRNKKEKNSRQAPLTLFTSFVQGKLEAHDHFLITCKHIFDYFSVEKVYQTLLTKNSDEAAFLISTLLKRLPGKVAVCGALFQQERALQASASPLPIADETSARMPLSQNPRRQAPSPLPSRASRSNATSPSAPTLERTPSFPRPTSRIAPSTAPAHSTTPPIREMPSSGHQNSVIRVMGTAIIASLTQAWAMTTSLIASMFRSLTASVKLRASALRNAVFPPRTVTPSAGANVQDAMPQWQRTVHSWISIVAEKFKRLPRMSKYLFIASLLLAILFIESVFSIAHEKVRTRELARYQESLNIVEMKQAEAEAALIYGDQEKAGAALRQAKAALHTLTSTPMSAVKDTRALEALSASIELLSQKVFRITTLENPEELLDLASFSEAQTPLAIGGLMGPYQKKFFAFNTSFAAVFLIDLDARTVTISSPDEVPGLERFIKAAMDDQGALFLTSPSRIARFNSLNNSVEILTTSLPLADIADIAVFGKRLYSLNRATGSIMRHDITASEVRQGSPWLSQDITLTGATSLAIDGSVYVADAQGVIRKFTRGKEDAFTLPTLEPPLRAPSRLTTNDTHIIVIEPTERRIIVLDQSGSLIQQITSPTFDRLIDAVYDARSRNFYVLNGTRIYAVPFIF